MQLALQLISRKNREIEVGNYRNSFTLFKQKFRKNNGFTTEIDE